jgi:hypothetical protein
MSFLLFCISPLCHEAVVPQNTESEFHTNVTVVGSQFETEAGTISPKGIS